MDLEYYPPQLWTALFLYCLLDTDGFAAGRTSSTLLFLLFETEDGGGGLVDGLFGFEAALTATVGLTDLFEDGGVFMLRLLVWLLLETSTSSSKIAHNFKPLFFFSFSLFRRRQCSKEVGHNRSRYEKFGKRW